MGECSDHIVFSCEIFVRVYINNTIIQLIKKEKEKEPGSLLHALYILIYSILTTTQ